MDAGGIFVDTADVYNAGESEAIEETLSTLDMLVTSGKLRYLGASNVPA